MTIDKVYGKKNFKSRLLFLFELKLPKCFCKTGCIAFSSRIPHATFHAALCFLWVKIAVSNTLLMIEFSGTTLPHYHCIFETLKKTNYDNLSKLHGLFESCWRIARRKWFSVIISSNVHAESTNCMHYQLCFAIAWENIINLKTYIPRH